MIPSGQIMDRIEEFEEYLRIYLNLELHTRYTLNWSCTPEYNVIFADVWFNDKFEDRKEEFITISSKFLILEYKKENRIIFLNIDAYDAWYSKLEEPYPNSFDDKQKPILEFPESEFEVKTFYTEDKISFNEKSKYLIYDGPLWLKGYGMRFHPELIKGLKTNYFEKISNKLKNIKNTEEFENSMEAI